MSPFDSMNHSLLMFYLNNTVTVLNYYLNLKIPLQYFWQYFEKYSFRFFTSLTTSHYKLFPTQENKEWCYEMLHDVSKTEINNSTENTNEIFLIFYMFYKHVLGKKLK